MRSTFLATLALSGLLATAVPVSAQNKESKVGGKTLDEWIKDLQPESKNRDPSMRQTAIGALTQFGEGAQKKGGSLLILALSDPDGSLRVNACIAIGNIGLDARDMDKGVTALVRLLTDTQAIVRLHATMALGRLGPAARAAIPKLTKDTINDKSSWEIRKTAAQALGSIAVDRENGPDAQTVGALTRAIHGQYADVCSLVRLEAIVSLSVLGVSSRAGEVQSVMKTLEGAMKDQDKGVEIWARVLTLGFNRDLPPEPHLKVIGKYLTNSDMQVRAHAARSLAAMGPRAKSLIPALIDNLRDKETEAASAAAQALVAMKDILTDRELDAIAESFKSNDPVLRARAAHMVNLLGDRGTRCIDQLIAALKDDDPQVIMISAFVLGEIGMPAKKALPALNNLTKHKELLIQNTAREAIFKIEGKMDDKPK